jgi:hypothetical protein
MTAKFDATTEQKSLIIDLDVYQNPTIQAWNRVCHLRRHHNHTMAIQIKTRPTIIYTMSSSTKHFSIMIQVQQLFWTLHNKQALVEKVMKEFWMILNQQWPRNVERIHRV